MTKGQLAERILRMLGVNTRFSDATPEEIQDVLRYIEDWMASNAATGRRIGWNESPDDSPDPNEDTGIPGWANMGVTASIALMVAPYFEKPANPMIARTAAIGMGVISAKTTEVQDVQYPSRMPRGSRSGPFSNKYYKPADRIRTFNDFLTDSGDDPITTP